LTLTLIQPASKCMHWATAYIIFKLQTDCLTEQETMHLVIYWRHSLQSNSQKSPRSRGDEVQPASSENIIRIQGWKNLAFWEKKFLGFRFF